MIDRLPILGLLALASLPAAPSAFGAPPVTQRNYSVTGFEKVRVDGPYQVQLKTNVAPFARASGSARALDAVSIKVEGQTLIIRAAGGASPIRIHAANAAICQRGATKTRPRTITASKPM